MNNIINRFADKLDPAELKVEAVNFIGEIFGADRCFIDDYDPVNKKFITPDYEYLSSERLMSFKGLKAEQVAPELAKKALKGEEIVFSDTDKYILENNLLNTQSGRFMKSFRMQSCAYMPIKFHNEMLGMLGIVYVNKKKTFREEEVELIRKLCEQIGIAIYQVRINAALESCAEREVLVRRIVQKIGGTMDLDSIKSYFVNQIARCFNADRVGLSLFDTKKEIFLPFDKSSEYLSDPDMFSFIDYDWSQETVRPFIEPLKQGKEVNFSNLYKYIQDNKLESSGILGLFSSAGIGSSVNVPVFSGKKIMGYFCVDFIKSGVVLSPEEMNFLRVLSDHLGIMLYQTELYEKERQTAQRELLMRNMIYTIRKTLNIEEVKRTLVTEIGKLFNADRCLIRDYDPKLKSYLAPTPCAEYLSSGDVKSLTDYCLLPEYSTLFHRLFNYKKVLVTNDTDVFLKGNNLERTAVDYFIRLFSIKSGIVNLVLSYQDKILGLLALHYTREKVKLSEEDINFIKSAADQVAIAIHQSELYESEKLTTQRELLLRNIISTIRSTFDINKIKSEIVKLTGEALNADRCLIDEFDANTGLFTPVNYEYRASEDEKSILGFNTEEFIPEICDIMRDGSEFIAFDLEEYFKERGMEECLSVRSHRQNNVKTDIAIPIIYAGKMYGTFALHYTQEKYILDEQQLDFIRILAAQTGIAFYQAELYETQKQALEREKIIRKFIETSRTTLDKEKFKEIAVKDVGESLGADRCLFAVYNKITGLYDPPFYQFAAGDDVKVIDSFDPYQNAILYFKRIISKEGELKVNDSDKFNGLYPEEPVLCENYFRDFDIKSDYAFPVWSTDYESACLVIHYTKEKVNLSEEYLGLMKTISNQATIAFTQADLFEKQRQAIEREKLQRKFSEIVRSTLDVDLFKKIAVEEIGKTFNANRCFIAVYDKKSTLFKEPEIQYLYPETLNKIETFDPYQDSIKIFAKIIADKGLLYLGSTDLFVEENNLQGSETEKYYRQYQIKSDYSIQIWDTEEERAYIVIQYTDETRYLTPDEVELHKYLTNQSAIAFRQAKLYEKEKQTSERESLLRRTIQTIRSTLDINEVLSGICDEIGKALNAGRTSIIQFTDPDDYTKWTVKREYKQKKEFIAISDVYFDPEIGLFWGSKLFEQKRSYMIENIRESDIPELLKETYEKMGLKTIIAIPIAREDEVWGGIFLSEYEYYRHWTEKEIAFIQTIADQVFIAIKQAELYEKEKATAQKERALREIISKITSTLDFNEIKKTFVTKVGEVLGSGLDIIYLIDPLTDKFITVDEYSVHQSSTDIESPVGINIMEDYEIANSYRAGVFVDVVFSDPEKFIKDNNLYGTKLQKFLYKYKIKSAIVIPLFYIDQFLGILAFNFIKEPRVITGEDVNFVRSAAVQASIALHQARLYEKEKQTTQRERLLREIIQSIRSSLDINTIKNEMVKLTGEYFNADRCFIAEFDKTTNSFFEVIYEYLSPQEGLSIVNFNISKGVPEVTDILEKNAELAVFDVEKYIEENNLQDSLSARAAKYQKVKSAVLIPIIYRDVLYGAFCLHYTQAKKILSEEQMELLRSISSQAGIAIYQSRLFEREKKTARRERLLREIIQAITGSLDLSEILSTICNKIANTYGVQRATIINFPNPEDYGYWVLKKEYKSRDDIKGLLDIDYDKKAGAYIGKVTLEDEKSLVIDNISESNTPEYYKKAYNLMGVKSALSVPVKRGEDKYGVIYLSEYDRYRHWTQEEISLLENIADQTYIAINQAELYEREKQASEKNKILRELVGEIRLSQSIEEVYTYIIAKIADLFSADRCFFMEIHSNEKETPSIKYEHSKIPGFKSVKNTLLPDHFIDIFRRTTKSLKPIIIEDTREFLPENKNLQDFFNEYRMRSIVSIPFVRYNMEIRILGILTLSTIEPRKWTDGELEILKAVSESVVRVVWEITKIQEIEELRNTFMLTLAHDLQVPLIGEKKAMEYLLSRPDDIAIGNYKYFIEAMAKDNINMINMLKSLLDIYNFEAGKKEFKLSICQISELIEDVVDSMKKIMEEKSIPIEIDIQEGLPDICADRAEIKNVIGIILENALSYTQPTGVVQIKAYQDGDNIITFIKDNGPGIPEHIRKKLFQRYAMVETIERKIGSGLGLYLSKQIIEAHKGKIWYETELGRGTTFYFSLPKA